MSNYVTGPHTFEQIRWAGETYHREPVVMVNLEADDPQFTAAIRDATPYLASLVASAREFDDLRCATLDIIESAFNSVAAHGFNPDTVSRILVALNPQLFVVWDMAIREAYFPDDEPNGATYGQFLSVMRMAALSIVSDARTTHGIDDAAGHISEALDLNPVIPLARFIDEYNWLTLTRAATAQPSPASV